MIHGANFMIAQHQSTQTSHKMKTGK